MIFILREAFRGHQHIDRYDVGRYLSDVALTSAAAATLGVTEFVPIAVGTLRENFQLVAVAGGSIGGFFALRTAAATEPMGKSRLSRYFAKAAAGVALSSAISSAPLLALDEGVAHVEYAAVVAKAPASGKPAQP